MTALRTITAIFVAVLLVGSVVFLARTGAQAPFAPGSLPIGPSPTAVQYSGAEKEAIERALQHLREHADEYYLERPDLSDLRVSRFVDDGSEYHVWLAQLYGGYPVVGNDIGVHIRKDGKGAPLVTGAGNRRPSVVLRNITPPYPGPGASALSPKLTAQEAVAQAFAATGARLQASRPPSAELVIYPVGRSGQDLLYTLAWQVRMMTAHPFGDWGVTLDAMTGEILVKRNYFVPEPTAAGAKPQSSPSPATATPTPTRVVTTPIIKIEQVPGWKSPTLPPPPPKLTEDLPCDLCRRRWLARWGQARHRGETRPA